MLEVTLNVTLIITGPVMTKSTAAGAYGVDSPFARDESGQIMLPRSLVKGRLNQALAELEEIGVQFNPPVKQLLGESGGYHYAVSGSAVDPARGLLDFTNFVHAHLAAGRKRYRIRIDKERGAVDEGAYQVLESPFRSGQNVEFKGVISYFAENQMRADQISQQVQQGFSWITGLGAQRTIGFGQLVEVLTTTSTQPVRQGHVVIAAQPAGPGSPTHFDLVVRPDSLFCLTHNQIDPLLFESADVIPGGALKGSIATTWLKLLGKNEIINAATDSARPELSRNFEQVRFTHFLPARRSVKRRPIAIPLSTVAAHNKQMHDVALCSGPILLGGFAPSFAVDWKDTESKEANQQFGWDHPETRLMVRNSYDRERRRATEHLLFAYEMVIPHEHEWFGQVDLSRVPDAERSAVEAQLRDLTQSKLRDLGKTKAAFTMEWQVGAFQPHLNSHVQARDGIWVITIQTPALLCDPAQLDEESGESELRAAYESVWTQLSGGLLAQDNYWAQQKLAGGNYLHERFQKGNPYNSFLLTDARSVFVLKPTGDVTGAESCIRKWLERGLPLPDWAVQRYGRRNLLGHHFTNCPYIPENGYGEIAVNLDVHWQPIPNGELL